MKYWTLIAAFGGMSGCATQPADMKIIALGNDVQIGLAARQGQSCGIPLIHRDPLDLERVLLKIGSNSSSRQKTCLMRWLKANAPETIMTAKMRKEIGLN